MMLIFWNREVWYWKMDLNTEQRYVIKLFWQLSKLAQQTCQAMKEVYQNDCLGQLTIFLWHNFFKKGRESAALEPHTHSGRPTSTVTETNINTGAAIIRDDRHMLVRTLKAWVTSRSHLYTVLSENICRCITFAPHGCHTFSRASKWSDVWKWWKNGYRGSEEIVIFCPKWSCVTKRGSTISIPKARVRVRSGGHPSLWRPKKYPNRNQLARSCYACFWRSWCHLPVCSFTKDKNKCRLLCASPQITPKIH